MDQHPIPQDVTGFQFKLIGTMTVKQFGYVAIGAVMAVICYYLPFNSAFGILLKVFLIPIIGASGVVIAFVPIDGRPIDIMTTNFVKALFAPNQYVYKRQGRKMSFSTVAVSTPAATAKAAQAQTQTTPRLAAEQSADKQEKLRAFLMSSQGRVKNDLDKKEASFLKSFTPVAPPPTTAAVPGASAPKFVAAAPAPAIPLAKPTVTAPATPTMAVAQPAPAPLIAKPVASISPVQPAPQPTPQKETSESLAQKEQQLEQQLAEAKQEEAKPHAPAEQTAAHVKVETLATQIEAIHSQKLQLEQELEKLKSQLSEQKNQPAAPEAIAQPAAPAAPAVAAQPAKPAIPIQDPGFVKVVQKQPNDKRSDLPKVSDTPNVVVGIVKDPRGNVLSNILVEVKDKNGNPVRAFKTNPLGQFASATPLSPGVYTMELEDPKAQHSFDVIQITANNEIMRPIEIISHDAREALRQQLFS